LAPLAARQRQQPAGAPAAVRRLQFAIDLGTSSCAVGMPVQADVTTHAILSVGSNAPFEERKTIGSAFYIGDDQRIVMDDAWIDAYRVATRKTGGVTYRSIKRLLFEHYHLNRPERERLTRQLEKIYEELLWLALDPSSSSTVQLLSGAGAFAGAVDAWKEKGGFPHVRDDRGRTVKMIATTEGFDVCISIPNSLMPRDVEVVVGAVQRAAEKVLKELRKGDEFDSYTPQVTTIREAEAVAWALPRHDLELGSDVVVLDVGAGTADAALVHYSRPMGGVPTHLVEYRTGSPFGGDDLDMLLACEAWTSQKDSPTFGSTLIPLRELLPDEKNRLLRGIRANKERWVLESGDDHLSVGISNTDLAPDLTVLEPSNVLVQIPAVAQNNARTFDQTATLVSPDGTEPYKAFLRYTVFLSCAALFRRLEGRQISAIILTGQSSLALGVRQYVEALAAHYRITAGSIRHLDDTDSEAMKLVCAEGAAVYANEIGTASNTFGDVVPETFVLKEHEEPIELFAAGSRAQHHQSNAMVVVDYPNALRDVYRYYCSPEDLLKKDLKLDWARKPIGRIPGDPNRRALAFRLDLRKEHIEIWAVDTNNEVTKVNFLQTPNLFMGKPPHPFLTADKKPLPLTWQTAD
jgi:hypothetical protein